MSVRTAWCVLVGLLLALGCLSLWAREVAQWVALPVLLVMGRAVGAIEQHAQHDGPIRG